MLISSKILSVYEPFIVHPIQFFIFDLMLAPFAFIGLDVTLTNITLTYAIIFSATFVVLKLIKHPEKDVFFLFQREFDSVLNLSFFLCQFMAEKFINVRHFRDAIFPLLFSLAIVLLLVNLTGNIPFCMALTTQIGCVFGLVVPSVLGMFFFSIHSRKVTFVRTFHSPGMSGGLAMLLFPIEVLTFFMRPISIICRLVANFLSGHLIFKVATTGFISLCCKVQSIGLISTLTTAVSVLAMIALVILEIGISVIQVYVFLVIFCLYVNDCLGHHFRH